MICISFTPNIQPLIYAKLVTNNDQDKHQSDYMWQIQFLATRFQKKLYSVFTVFPVDFIGFINWLLRIFLVFRIITSYIPPLDFIFIEESFMSIRYPFTIPSMFFSLGETKCIS